MRRTRFIITSLLVPLLTVVPEVGAAAPESPTPVAQARPTVELPVENAESDSIQAITYDECDQNDTGPEDFWFKDRFTICRSEETAVLYMEMSSSGPVHRGTSFFRVTQVGQTQPGTNQIRFGVRVVFVRSERIIDVLHRYAVTTSCINNDLTRTSTCEHQQQTVEKTIDQWRAERGSQPIEWAVTGTTTAVPADKYKEEYRGFFKFDLVLTVSGGPVPPSSYRTPSGTFRCDRATYVSGSKCVFDGATPVLLLDANSPEYGASAQFIRNAQEDITRTKPGLAGTKVPGRLNDKPLTRLYSGYDTEHRINGSRRKIRRVCRQHWGVRYTAPTTTGGPKRQCDEYPFATTYENASLVDESSQWSFAVEAIPGSHNEAAGRLYGAWLGTNHMLDGDPFFVVVR